jgi:uncharacterized protein
MKRGLLVEKPHGRVVGLSGFLDKNEVVAVVGASSNPKKWGSKIFRTLKSLGFMTYPVNPNHKRIDGDVSYPDLHSLPELPDVVVTVVSPNSTELVVSECKELGVGKVWMQQGSESNSAVEFCKKNNIEVAYNLCFLTDGIGGPSSIGNVTFACKNITHEELIRCSFTLNKTEYNILVFLLRKTQERGASEIAGEMGLERTTVQKAIKTLLEKRLIVRSRKNLPKGGYSYTYKINGMEEIKTRMKYIVHEWYNRVEKEIDLL